MGATGFFFQNLGIKIHAANRLFESELELKFMQTEKKSEILMDPRNWTHNEKKTR